MLANTTPSAGYQDFGQATAPVEPQDQAKGWPASHLRLLTEKLISYAQAAKIVPPSRQGRPVSPATLSRWAKNGVRGSDGTIVRLESIRLGGRSLTTVEALARFSERLSTPSDRLALSAPPPETRTSTQRHQSSSRAADELERKGV